jgi:hypothetical protein
MNIKLRFPARNRAGMTEQVVLQFLRRTETHRLGFTVPGVAIAAFGDPPGIPDIMPVVSPAAGALKKIIGSGIGDDAVDLLQRRAVNGANNRLQMGDFEPRFIGSHGV